jgi:hypothetical protein
MPGDLPDYTRQVITYVSGDIRAQIGSLPWWLRYPPSRIIYLDDFNEILNWVVEAGPVTLDCGVYSFEGYCMMKMVTRGNPALTTKAHMPLGLTPRSKTAMQLRWWPSFTDDVSLGYVEFRIDRYNGVTVDSAALRYLKNATTPQNKWQYLNGAGGYSDVPGGSQTIDTTVLTRHFFRLIVDFTAAVKGYSRFESDDLIVDLSGVPIYTTASAVAPNLRPVVDVKEDVLGVNLINIDAFCLSDNEA